ncbi:protein-L-isoaspartatecarboxylmethyltransferase [Mizugakiibacter sediminis]|uniref:Protein-L-isoaspartate O-methyltransferase n=2 Tax=Mizugakiibacter sediminis TaxID=1475481 RepID=A0A0K8QNV4_9GAMM|nr:protein-L-isoaspartatecarboxylmethyltransferase [Mizugakiibacter sediminis]
MLARPQLPMLSGSFLRTGFRNMSIDLELARQNMVTNQVRPWEVLDANVLDALAAVPREEFVPSGYRNLAFADIALPLGHGETMMKPVVEGRMLQALELTKSDGVLEIGTGSGFITACLARLAGEVVSVDMHADFVEAARARLATLGIGNAGVAVAEAVQGYEPNRQFDAIAVTGAVYALPERFRRWLKPGGRLFVVRGESPVMQAVLMRHEADGRFSEEILFETDLTYLANAAPPKRFVL